MFACGERWLRWYCLGKSADKLIGFPFRPSFWKKPSSISLPKGEPILVECSCTSVDNLKRWLCSGQFIIWINQRDGLPKSLRIIEPNATARSVDA